MKLPTEVRLVLGACVVFAALLLGKLMGLAVNAQDPYITEVREGVVTNWHTETNIVSSIITDGNGMPTNWIIGNVHIVLEDGKPKSVTIRDGDSVITWEKK